MGPSINDTETNDYPFRKIQSWAFMTSFLKTEQIPDELGIEI